MKLIAQLRRVAATTGAETFGVAVAALSGFLIVNVLPKESYAQYTLLVSIMTLTVGLSDMGLTHCYLPIVGERNRDVPWVIGACRRVYEKRWRLLLAAAVFIVPYWFWTMREHGWLQPAYLIGSVAVVCTVMLTMHEQLLRMVSIIFGKVREVNRVGLAANAARLSLVAGALWLLPETVRLPALFLAAAVASGVGILGYRRLKELSGFTSSALGGSERVSVDSDIRRIVAPLIVPSLFYQCQGVITVVLVSLLGTAVTIAEIGALSRLALVLTIVDRVTGVLLFPRIASAAAGPALRAQVLKVHGAYLLLMLLLLSTAVFLPQYWIALLGGTYREQAHLVWMAFLPAIFMNGSGFAFTTLSARGYTVAQIYSIPLIIGVQAAYLAMLGVNDTRSALWFNIATATVYFVYQYGLLAAWIVRRAGNAAGDFPQAASSAATVRLSGMAKP